MDRSSLYKKLPQTPGVYLMRDKKGVLLYVGKAANLRRRVSSYFTRPHDNRIQRLVDEIYSIDHRGTDTTIEALVLESDLIKKHEPPFNIREKDDKSFLFFGITRDPFPRVVLMRGKDIDTKGVRWRKIFGPFTSASSIREAVKILRKIFPFSTHEAGKKFLRSCFDYQIGLCPGVCVGKISKTDYLKNIKNLALFFEGEKKKIVKNLKKEVSEASKKLEFEKAQKLQRQLFSLEHIQDVALIHESEVAPENSNGNPFRIEGYDISNISGTSAVGSMVVFLDGKSAPSEYRKFKIKTVQGANDIGMMKEVLERRFNSSWSLPQLILMDGGSAQVNIARRVVSRAGLRIPVVGLAKGPERKRNDLIGGVPKEVSLKTLIAVRDEAHRFAINYHKQLRTKAFLGA
ncbi:MAG: GIY-YIG nuclease family protein [Patescibacteria group bacterium]